MALDKQFIEQIQPAIEQTWGYVSADVDWNVTNSEAVELCIDADRITSFTKRKDIDNLIGDHIKQFSYSKVHKYICKNIKLVY